MLLVIDVGNTNYVLGVYRGDKLISAGVWQQPVSEPQTKRVSLSIPSLTLPM